MSASRHLLLFTSCLLLLSGSGTAFANWSWKLPARIYQNVDFGQRAALDRAQEAYQRAETAENRRRPVNDLVPLYRAAAAEYKKFQLQYELEASDAISAYVLFMQGYSLQGARDRHAAINTYTELLDYFADEHWIATAALYHIGEAQLDNGDERLALNTFHSLVEDPVHMRHPLAARALHKLALAAWRTRKPDQALDYWKEAMTPEFEKSASQDYREIRDYYAQALSLRGRWSDYEEVIFDEFGPQDAKKKAETVQKNVDWLLNRNWHFWGGWYYDRYFDKEKERNERRLQWRGELVKWYETLRPLFVEADREWDHAITAFRLWRDFDAKEGAKQVPRVTKLLTTLPPDEETRAKYARQFGIQLADYQMYDEARTLLEYVKDQVANLWLSYEIERRANEQAAAVLALEALMAQPDPEVILKAKKTLAWYHKDHTRQYDKAIPLYLDIAEPPGTLWALQECYRKDGKKSEAYTTLSELASIFPSEAARATWTQAQYREQDGEKDRAIALYRRLLSQPEWKKTAESSWAHQALERLGIATGGAVIHEVR